MRCWMAASRVIMTRPSGVFTSRTVFMKYSRLPASTRASLLGRPFGLPLTPFTHRPCKSRTRFLSSGIIGSPAYFEAIKPDRRKSLRMFHRSTGPPTSRRP